MVLKLNAVQMLALACLGVALGSALRRRLPALERLNIPTSIVGGLVYALCILALRPFVTVEMDTTLRDLLMVAFFTTIGMGASLTLIRQGGVQVVWFLLLATVGAILQNGVGIAFAKALGLSPLIGVVSGSVALTGGPATALAFGATFEKMGVTGASTVGVASAMFGITAGGLLGGFIGGRLVRSRQLRSNGRGAVAAPVTGFKGDAAEEHFEHTPWFRTMVALAVAMGAGSMVSAGVERMGVVLPSYVGAMIVAALLRNLDDRFRFVGISERHVEAVGNFSLYVFIVMALLTLRLWELVHLALPIMVLLAAQVVLVWLLCAAVFRAMGQDYEAAVMSSGFCGFMLGTTANAMACMGVLTEKFGPAPRAFIVVPLVGAFLIDFTNALIITAAANLFR